jgi:hypothetical protein
MATWPAHLGGGGDVHMQPKCRSLDLRQGEHNNQKGHRRAPRGAGAKALGRSMHNVQQPLPF